MPKILVIDFIYLIIAAFMYVAIGTPGAVLTLAVFAFFEVAVRAWKLSNK